LAIGLSDADDDMVLETAMNGRADAIVTRGRQRWDGLHLGRMRFSIPHGGHIGVAE
jgi:predicted nucleic acid-binding protein